MSIRILFTANGVALGGAVLGAGLRLLAVPRAVSDVDSVNFARALSSFDPLGQAPHLPGYPVYVAVTKGFAALGLSDVHALSLPAALLWPLAAWVLFVGMRRFLGDAPALGASLVASLAPGVVLVGGWPASDGFGFTLLCLASGTLLVGVASPSHDEDAEGALDVRFAQGSLVMGAVALGLLLGVRLSWAPLVGALLLAALLVARTDRARIASSFALGVVAWLLPLLVRVGPRFVEASLAFGRGHLESWGGTALSTGAPLSDRALRAAWDVWAAGLGGPWAGLVSSSTLVVLVVALLAAAGLARSRPPPRLFALLSLALPYVLYVVALQNVEKPRHLVVLLPLLGAFLVFGLSPWLRAEIAGAMVAVALVAVTLPRALEQGGAMSPALALVSHVGRAYSPVGLQVFAGEEARVLEHHLPMVRVWRPRDGEVLAREAELAHARGAQVLVTSGTPGLQHLASALEPVASFSANEVVHAHDPTLVLYRFAAAAPKTGGSREALVEERP